MEFNNLNKSDRSQNGGSVILWDRVIIAVAILTVVIIGCISMIVYVATGNKASNVANNLNNKTVESLTYGKEFEEPPVVEEDTLKYTVCIDAGHGGEDSGSTNWDETRLEKDDNLRVSMLVKAELENLGVDVLMTRNSDEFVSLDDRCDMANKAEVDLFISLHRNSATDGQGVEIWVSNKEIFEDTLLGQNIIDALDNIGVSENRGVQFGYIGKPTYNYQVNYDTDMPSCLVELGFITNDDDNELFDENLDDYAQAIAEAIFKTLGEIYSDK